MNQENKKKAHKVGLKNNLSDEVVQEIINSPFEFIREQIQGMVEVGDFKNFRIINLGILHTSERRVRNLKEKKNDNK